MSTFIPPDGTPPADGALPVPGDPTAAELLDEGLATLVEGCDVLGIPPEEWHSGNVGQFDPDSTEGWQGRVDASDEDPPDLPPRYFYDLRLRGPALAGQAAIDAAAQEYSLLRLAGGWEPFSDFASGGGDSYRRTIYFSRADGARTGLVFDPRGTTQTYDSPTTTDPAVNEPGLGTDAAAGDGLDGQDTAGESATWRPGG
ncbi:MAG TPA: hypothetical protein GX743_04815 [Actinomycetales bacterium]|nr:hypothetical protein [Actinomycetales bacterium]